MKKIILLIVALSFIITGCSKKENECCECKDCPECDMCCPCGIFK